MSPEAPNHYSSAWQRPLAHPCASWQKLLFLGNISGRGRTVTWLIQFSLQAFEPKQKIIITRFLLEKAVDFLTEYFITKMRRFNIIPVYFHDPPTPEERPIKRQVNRRALEARLASLEENNPLAIAPSGGSTHEAAEVDAVQIIVPTLASFLYRKGKIVKIVPCVIKQRPPVTKQTYASYLVDRVWLLRKIKSLLKRLKGERYCRPQVMVEFLSPLTFPYPYPTKGEKVAFVWRLQQLMFKAMNSNS